MTCEPVLYKLFPYFHLLGTNNFEEEEKSLLLTRLKPFLELANAILCYSHKLFQEYDWAGIFRLGRPLSGSARGPGVFFIIHSVDIYEKIDLRVTGVYKVPIY